MKYTVRVHARARQPFVEKTDTNELTVAVHEPPEHGKANSAVINALADHFNVPKSRIRIVAGHTARVKIVEIL